jgi:hypothetical protein
VPVKARLREIISRLGERHDLAWLKRRDLWMSKNEGVLPELGAEFDVLRKDGIRLGGHREFCQSRDHYVGLLQRP